MTPSSNAAPEAAKPAHVDQGAERPPLTVYISHWFPDASETFIFYEVEGLHARGFPVRACSLYALRRRDLSPGMLHTPVPVDRLGTAALPRVSAAFCRALVRDRRLTTGILHDLLLRPWRTLELRLENLWAGLCGFYLAEHFTRLGVGHVHAAWGNGPATAAWVVQRLAGIPFSISVHSVDVRPHDGALGAKLADARFARADSSCNMPVLAALEPDKAAAKHRLIYTSRTLSPAGDAAVPLRFPLRLLCVGRLLRLKGFQHAVEAVALLAQRGIEAALSIAGSGLWAYPLRRRVRKLGLEKRVHFLGFVTHDRLSELMLDSDMLLMPSLVQAGGRSDSLPTVLVEAMLHGLPVIGSDIAGFGDVIRHGETGLLVPTGDSVALAVAVRQLAENRENALRMAGNGKALVMTMFDPAANLSRLEALFTENAGRSRL